MRRIAPSGRAARHNVGIDLHMKSLEMCVVDDLGQEERRARLPLTSDEAVKTALRTLLRWSSGGRFAVEAVGMNRWLVEALQERGCEVVVVDPLKLGLKALGKKTDRRDAYEIARRLALGDIDRNARTYYPTLLEYTGRKVPRTRQRLVNMRQQLVNQIRALFRAYHIPVKPARLQTPYALRWLSIQKLPSEGLTMSLRALVHSLAAVQRSIDALDAEIRQLAKAPEVALLVESLPSIADKSALMLLRELGDVSRFCDSRCLASYAGLAPRVNQSADRAHHGSITHRGSRMLRTVLVQWAVRLLARNETAKAWAAPRLKRAHKNKVRVALARRLLVGLYHMLKTNEPFDLERCLNMQRALNR